jgi:hypothetical protein
MKKLGLLVLIIGCIALLSSALFYWVKWNTQLQARVIESKINGSKFKIAEEINLETTFNIPIHCDAELMEFSLPDGLKEHNSGVTFKQKSPNTLMMTESFFAVKEGIFKDLKRELTIKTPKGLAKLTFSYPEFEVDARVFSSESKVKFFDKIELKENYNFFISIEYILIIIIMLSLVTTVIFVKNLPKRSPSPIQIFRSEIQKFYNYQESPDSQPLMRLQDLIRSLIAQQFDERFRSIPLKHLSWEKLSEKDTHILKPILEKIHASRFTGDKLSKAEFHGDIQALINWSDELITEERK